MMSYPDKRYIIASFEEAIVISLRVSNDICRNLKTNTSLPRSP